MKTLHLCCSSTCSCSLLHFCLQQKSSNQQELGQQANQQEPNEQLRAVKQQQAKLEWCSMHPLTYLWLI